MGRGPGHPLRRPPRFLRPRVPPAMAGCWPPGWRPAEGDPGPRQGKRIRPDDEGRHHPALGPVNRPGDPYPAGQSAPSMRSPRPGGKTARSAGADQMIHIWNPDSGRSLTDPRGVGRRGLAADLSARTGHNSPPPDSTARSGSGTSPRVGRPDPHGAHQLGARAGLQPRTGRGWHPRAPTRRCGCGTQPAGGGARPAPARRSRARVVQPHGGRLAAASADGIVHVWETGAP